MLRKKVLTISKQRLIEKYEYKESFFEEMEKLDKLEEDQKKTHPFRPLAGRGV